jgi:hypothetical protein
MAAIWEGTPSPATDSAGDNKKIKSTAARDRAFIQVSSWG